VRFICQAIITDEKLQKFLNDIFMWKLKLLKNIFNRQLSLRKRHYEKEKEK